VNHLIPGHPHVHVIVNGRDELGEDLVINGDYIAHGIRERASELVTLELVLSPQSSSSASSRAEIDQDRFTRVDRALIAEAAKVALTCGTRRPIRAASPTAHCGWHDLASWREWGLAREPRRAAAIERKAGADLA